MKLLHRLAAWFDRKAERSAVVEECEPRILYSADAVPWMWDGTAEVRLVDDAAADSQGGAAVETCVAPGESTLPSALRVELVFIDSRVADRQALIDDLTARSDGSTQFEVVIVDSGSDGLAQIDAALAGRSGIDALHIVSHGDDGVLLLGSRTFDAAALTGRADELGSWQSALGDDADILVYGCDVAAGEGGQALLSTLAQFTRADIAASTDTTGAASSGGNWLLEAQTGSIETRVAFSADLQANWQAGLATYVVTNTNDSGAGSLRQAIVDANNNPGADIIAFNIAGTGPHAINVASALPTITGSVVIDGWSEPDYSAANPAPVITIDGNATTGAIGINIAASDVTIRGLNIQRFDTAGIYLQAGSNNNTIQGNFIGTSAAGTALAEAAGSMSDGIQVRGSNNLIGGSTAQARNIIAGTQDGIRLTAATATGNVIQGNYIGTDVTATLNLGVTDDAVDIGGSAAGNTVGGTGVGQGNVIAYSGDEGVEFRADAGANNGAAGNSFFGNASQAINDLNTPLAAPTLSTASSSGGSTNIQGTLTSTASTTFRIDFYATPSLFADAAGGEGRRYLGSASVTTNGAGTATISATLAVAVNNGDRISATATNTSGKTSEFSANITAAGAANEIVVDTVSDVADGTTTSITNLLNARGADGLISLREAIVAANATPGVDTIRFAIPGYGTHTINVGSALPQITEAVVIDGSTEPDYAGAPVVRVDGAAAGFSGISIGATGGGSTIRGLMITGFTVDGINVASGANNVTIDRNWIGTAGTGTTGIGNSGVGNSDDSIDIAASGAIITNNVITNSGDDGLTIVGSGVLNHVIQGNIIGLDPDGASGSGNTDVGLAIISGTNVTIGGTAAGQRNVISNNWEGMEINTANNTIQGNYVGTDASGTLNRGNRLGDGIQIQGAAANTVVGGTAAGAGNLIAYNAGDGVSILAGAGHQVLGNIIYSNADLGIDLGTTGVSANDAGDGDSGANNLQNFPALTGAVSSGGNTTITGTFNSTASTTFRIEFFSAPTADASGYGEGQTYLGFATVVTDASGNATINTTLTGVAVTAGHVVSATATVDLGGGNYGSTSEFSAAVTCGGAPVNTVPGAQTVNEDTALAIGGVSVTDAEGNLSTVRLTVGNGTVNVSLAGGAGISAGANGSATLTLSGSQAQINAALATLTYQGASNYNGADTLTVLSTDALGATDSDGVSITVNAVNDPPVLGSASLTVSEGQTVTLAPANFGITDPDSASFTYTASGISGGYFQLSSAAGTPITTFTTAQLAGGLVQFVDNGDEVAPAFSVTVNDGAANSNTLAATITYTPVNDTPVLTAGAPDITFVEGGAAQVIDALFTVSDVDSADFAGGTLTVSITANGSAADRLQVGNFGIGAGQVGVSGANVTYGGVTIGSFSGGTDGSTPLVVTFNANATAAAVQELARSIQFDNVSDTPSTAARQVTFTLTDGDGGTAAPQVETVYVQATNDAPVFTVPPGTTAYTEGATVFVTPSATLTDVDSPDLSGGQLVISITAGGESTDRLYVNSQGTGPGQVFASGASVFYNGGSGSVLVGTISGGYGASDPLVITFNGNSTPAAAAAITSQVLFWNTSDNPAATSRTLTLQVTDGDGGTSQLRTRTISVTPVNDAPVIAGLSGDSVAYSEGAGAIVIEQGGNATVTDVDSMDFDTGTLTVSFAAGGDSAEDVLGIRNEGGGVGQIGVSGASVTYGGVTIGTLTGGSGGADLVVAFNADSSAAAAQALIRNITYTNTDSAAPTTGNRTIRFVLTDGDGGTSGSHDATVTVSAVNNAPVLTSANLALSEGQTVTLAPANFGITDPDSSSFTYTVSGVSGGYFQLSSAAGAPIASFTTAQLTGGLVQFVDDGNEAAPAFSVKVNDGSADSNTLAATVTYNPVNDPPTLNTAALTVGEGQTVTLSGANFGVTDPDSASFTYTISGLSGGYFQLSSAAGTPITSFSTAQLGAGLVQFVDDGDEVAPAFSVTVNDGSADSNILAGTITYSLVNDPPVLVSAALTVSEGQTVTLSGANFGITDPDNTSFTYTLSGISGGYFELSSAAGTPITSFTTAQLAGGLVQFVDDGNEVAPTFNVTVNDGSADSNTLAASIVYNPVNDPPALNTAALTVTEGQTLTLAPANFGITDPDSSNFIYTVSGISGGYFQLSSAAGTPVTSFTTAQLGAGLVQFVDDGDEVAPAFSVTVNDGALDSNTVVATITYNPVNDPPVLTSATLSVNEGQTVTLAPANFGINDPDNSSFTYAVSGISGGYFQLSSSPGTPVTSFTTAQLAGGLVQFVDDGNEVAPAFSVTVNDGAANSNTLAATITYTPVNDPPVVSSAALTLNEGQTVTLAPADFGITDPDSSSFTYTLSGISGGYFQLATAAGTPVTTFTGVQLGAGQVQFVDDGNELAPSFSVTVNDGSADSNTLATTITYTPQNDAPVITGATLTLSEGQTVTLGPANFGITDPDSSSFTYTVIGTSGGYFQLISAAGTPISSFTSAQLGAGLVQFVDDGDEVAPAFSVTINDGAANSNTLGATITYTPVNDPPLLTSAALTVSEGQTVTLSGASFGISDPDSSGFTYAVSIISGGYFQLSGAAGTPITGFTSAQLGAGLVQFVDDGDEVAPAFSVTVNDGTVDSNTLAATITYTPQNDAPVITGATLTLSEGTTVTLAPANFGITDPDSANFSYTVSGIAGGYFQLSSAAGTPITSFTTAQLSAGQVQFVDDGDEVAPGFSVTVNDGTSSSNTLAALITYAAVNDAPTITSDGGGAAATLSAAENTIAVTTVAASDVDLPSQTLAYAVVGGADAARFAIDPVSGALRFVIAPDHENPADADGDNVYDVVVQASDGTLAATQNLAVRVANVNEAPTALAPASAQLGFGAAGGTAVTTLVASDPDPADTLRFQLLDDAGGRFTVDASTGLVSVASGVRLDDASATQFQLVVRVTDAGGLNLDRPFVVTLQGMPTLPAAPQWPATPPAAPPVSLPTPTPTPAPAPEALAPMAAPPAPAATGEGQQRRGERSEADALSGAGMAMSEADRPAADEGRRAPARVQLLLRPRDGGEGFTATVSFAGGGEIQNVALSWDDIGARALETAWRGLTSATHRIFSIESDDDPAAAARRDDRLGEVVAMMQDPIRVSSVTFAAGFVWWLTRSGGLLTTLLLGIPAWRHVDLLPVLARRLDDEDDEDDDRFSKSDEPTHPDDLDDPALAALFERVRAASGDARSLA